MNHGKGGYAYGIARQTVCIASYAWGASGKAVQLAAAVRCQGRRCCGVSMREQATELR
ncbi:protein of unknown function [Blastococcus saxobsidens DD2]|uniref:Uncharacterized protein n=1 Tax=Blastococcus saxobsidens (strain DD2) TaxID=1146883 RepID=H6RVQ4_BLASD|nr:protein of unknown function [Blastococcus saxobsidens DD2]